MDKDMTEQTNTSKSFSMRKEMTDIIVAEVGETIAAMEKGNVYQSIAKLPLHLFEDNFLSFFKGEIKDKEEAEKLRDLWFNVSGHGGRSVDIFDQGTGETLFRIPSLVNGNLIDSTKSEAFSYALRQYKYHAERSHSTAIMYLIKNKDKITENVIVDNPEKVRATEWASFVNYYKLGKSDSVSAKPQNENDIDDFFDFGI